MELIRRIVPGPRIQGNGGSNWEGFETGMMHYFRVPPRVVREKERDEETGEIKMVKRVHQNKAFGVPLIYVRKKNRSKNYAGRKSLAGISSSGMMTHETWLMINGFPAAA